MANLGAIAQKKPGGETHYRVRLPLPASYWIFQTPATTVNVIASTVYNKALPI